MKVALIGLGKMGEAIAYRAIQAGHSVIGFDVNKEMCDAAQKIGVKLVVSIADFAHHDVHVFWLMVPQGELVDQVIAQLRPLLQPGDIVVDGGNSKFTDSMRRAQELAAQKIFFLDCGTSGGIRGREQGFCLMVGGDKKAYAVVEPLLQSIAAPEGYAYLGLSGTGHYVKMVHNGIEYALLQAYAEGFQLLKEGVFKDAHLDLEKVAALWQSGSI